MLRTLLIISALSTQLLFFSAVFASNFTSPSAKPHAATRAKSYPLTFKWADDTPIVGRTFPAYKKAELQKLRRGETLEITGLYSAQEQLAAGNPAPNLGLARAAKTAALFAPPNRNRPSIPSLRSRPIKLMSGLVTDDNFSEISKKIAPFASVSFATAAMPSPQANDSWLNGPTVILFPIRKAKRHPNLQISAYLRTLAAALKTDKKRVTLTGFADTRGSSDMNLRLAKQRAESVKQELTKLGAPVDQIEISTKIKPAEVQPGPHNDGADNSIGGRQRNRRVEVSLR